MLLVSTSHVLWGPRRHRADLQRVPQTRGRMPRTEESCVFFGPAQMLHPFFF